MYYTNTYYVYILANEHNDVLYIGVTNDLQRRVFEHKTGITKGFTWKYNVHKLVWYDHFDSIESAIEREKQMKKWKREWKNNLINEKNPLWQEIILET